MPIVPVKISLTLKIKQAIIMQVREAKSVAVIWRRDKRELMTQPATLNPDSHDAKIDDVFSMKTSLDYDTDEKKYQAKNSVLELIFENTK